MFEGEDIEALKRELLRDYHLDKSRDHIKVNKRSAKSIDIDTATPLELMSKAIADHIPQRRDCVLRKRK